jgi:hypothetical protein
MIRFPCHHNAHVVSPGVHTRLCSRAPGGRACHDVNGWVAIDFSQPCSVGRGVGGEGSSLLTVDRPFAPDTDSRLVPLTPPRSRIARRSGSGRELFVPLCSAYLGCRLASSCGSPLSPHRKEVKNRSSFPSRVSHEVHACVPIDFSHRCGVGRGVGGEGWSLLKTTSARTLVCRTLPG